MPNATTNSANSGRKCLVIGACDARRLGLWLSKFGFELATHSPESTFELLQGNDRIEEVAHYFESRGIGKFLKTERVAVRAKLAGCHLAVIVPFFEYTALYKDRETGCVFTLRVLKESHYWSYLGREISNRVVPFSASREQYHLNLAESVRKLALDFPGTDFLLLLHGYPLERFGPRAFYNCPFVSNTYEDYFAMAEEARAVLPPRFKGLANVECVEMRLPFLDLIEQRHVRPSEVFPFFVPTEHGYRRDIAHISEYALRALAQTIAAAHFEEPAASADPYTIETIIHKLNSGNRDLWANALEDSMVSGKAADVSAAAGQALCSALSASPEDPALLLMIYAFGAFLRHGGIECSPQAFEEVNRYFLRKDLEYGAWKKFFALALQALTWRDGHVAMEKLHEC